MRKTAIPIPAFRSLHRDVFIALRHFWRQLGFFTGHFAYQPCPVRTERRPPWKIGEFLGLIGIGLALGLSPGPAQGESTGKYPAMGNARFSNQVQMDRDQILTPFQLKGTYAQYRQPTSPKPTHGIVGLDLLITRSGYPLVTGVFPETPAERQGIQPGDLIVAVNGVQTVEKTRAQVDAMISDRPGDTVEFMIGRGEQLKTIRLKVAALENLSDFARAGFTAP